MQRDGVWVSLREQQVMGHYRESGQDDPEGLEAEWVVPVRWAVANPASDAYWERGMFANQNSACKLRQEFTLDKLARHFGLDEADA